MSNFQDTPAEPGNAHDDTMNGTAAGDATGPVRDEEKYKQARAAGWAEPKAYDYNAAQAKHGDAPAPSSAEQVDNEDEPGWMHNAIKYEWKEEFGDVGPEVPELEAQLFRGDSRTRTGQHLDK